MCELTDEHTRQLFQRSSGKLASFGAPVHGYKITISRILKQGFGGESVQFVREDRLDNIGTGMRVNLLLGPGNASYEICVRCENWWSGEKSSESSEAAATVREGLRIRVVAPSVEDILAEAGNEKTQVETISFWSNTFSEHSTIKKLLAETATDCNETLLNAGICTCGSDFRIFRKELHGDHTETATAAYSVSQVPPGSS